MADALWQWDAVALAAAIRERKVSAVDVASACIGRMHEVNPALNAVTVDLVRAGVGAGATTPMRRWRAARRSARCTACR